LQTQNKYQLTMNTHQIKLIDSTYMAGEGKDLLLSLINDKIRFIKRKIFSTEERFGSDTAHLRKRVAELKQEKEQLLQVLGQLKSDDQMLEIDCHVHLKIHESEHVIV
jgi:hypothetical protein